MKQLRKFVILFCCILVPVLVSGLFAELISARAAPCPGEGKERQTDYITGCSSCGGSREPYGQTMWKKGENYSFAGTGENVRTETDAEGNVWEVHYRCYNCGVTGKYSEELYRKCTAVVPGSSYQVNDKIEINPYNQGSGCVYWYRCDICEQLGAGWAGGVKHLDQPDEYTLTVSSGEGGTVSGSVTCGYEMSVMGKFKAGDSITLTAEPYDGYEFTGWSGYKTSSGATLSFTMPGNKVSVTANFRKKADPTPVPPTEAPEPGEYSVSTSIQTADGSAGNSYISGGGFYKEGDSVTLSITLDEGCRMFQWNGNANSTLYENMGSGTSVSFTMPARNVSVTATIFGSTKPSVTPDPGEPDITPEATPTPDPTPTPTPLPVLYYSGNGKDSGYVYSQTGPYISSVRENGFSKTGHSFTGWNTNPAGTGTSFRPGDSMTIYRDTWLYAQWKADDYTVTFDWNFDWNAAGTDTVKNGADTKNVTYGTAYGTLPQPSRKGYGFLGWYTAETDGNGSGTLVTGNRRMDQASPHTLYAKWKAKEPAVVFDFNFDWNAPGVNTWPGGADTKTVVYDGTYGLLPAPKREGYVFLGWHTAETGGNGSGVKIAEDSTVLTETAHTLYAEWEPLSMTVTLDFNFDWNRKGTDTVKNGEDERTVTYDGTYGTLPVPERKGYDFLGWYAGENGGNGDGVKVTAATVVKKTSSHAVYAKWVQKNIRVTYGWNFDWNAPAVKPDRNGYPDSLVHPYDSLYKLPEPGREGYSFTGWYTAETGGNGSGTRVTGIMPVTRDVSHTVYAGWKADRYAVGFDSAGGTSCGGITVEYDSKYGPLPVPEREGYTFLGWKNESGVTVTENTVVKITAPQTLTAQWNAVTCTVTFDTDGGSAYAGKTVTYGKPYGTLPTTVKTGYGFTGWYYHDTAANTAVKVTEDSVAELAEDHTLTAHWIPKEVTVDLDWNFNWNRPGVNTDRHYGSDTLTVTYDSAYGTLPFPSREGYSFTGWYTSETAGNGSGSTVTASTIVKTAGRHTLYAGWKVNSYSISFEENGGSAVADKEVSYDSPYGMMPVPSAKEKITKQ